MIEDSLMQNRITNLPIKLDDDTSIFIETVETEREKDISNQKIEMEFKDFSKSIEKIATLTLEPLKKTKAKKISIKMGLSVGIESGALTAIIVKGTGKANFEVTIEWTNDEQIS